MKILFQCEKKNKNKKNKNKNESKIEFSKIIVYIIGVFDILINIYACIMIGITLNLEPFIYIIPSSQATTAIALAFYFNKAKAENKIKLMSTYGIKPKREDFNNETEDMPL